MQVTKGESEWTQNEIGAQVVDDLLISVTLHSKGVDKNFRLWMHLFTTVGAISSIDMILHKIHV